VNHYLWTEVEFSAYHPSAPVQPGANDPYISLQRNASQTATSNSLKGDLMARRTTLNLFLVVALAIFLAGNLLASAKPALITQKIDNSKLVTLTGNTGVAVTKANDGGPVAADLVLEHLFLQLRRPAALESALDEYIEQLHNPSSPNFHKWLTANQLGATYGLASSDHRLADLAGIQGQCRVSHADGH
jgi:hypothetical protein